MPQEDKDFANQKPTNQSTESRMAYPDKMIETLVKKDGQARTDMAIQQARA